jgi:hypothetical protein
LEYRNEDHILLDILRLLEYEIVHRENDEHLRLNEYFLYWDRRVHKLNRFQVDHAKENRINKRENLSVYPTDDLEIPVGVLCK